MDSPIAVEPEDLSNESLDIAIKFGKLRLGTVQTSDAQIIIALHCSDSVMVTVDQIVDG